jgi:hypothetical protein
MMDIYTSWKSHETEWAFPGKHSLAILEASDFRFSCPGLIH